jgi:16S rRNA (adenine1518-N6/adenine1519-N6)-dimethyltransferase
MPRAKRGLGQHFLSDPGILRRIVDALDPAPDDVVLEIGPGRGSLTAVLLERGADLTAIERDQELIAALESRFPTARIVPGDALALDWSHFTLGRPFLLVGNIPYQITSPLLEKALTPPRARRIVFLVQREVADRLVAEPGIKPYGALTIGVKAFARVERLLRVPAGAFHPAPKVQSAVIRLTPLEEPLVPNQDVREFRRMVVGLFGFRRKQLLRAVRGLTSMPAADVAQALRQAQLAETARPETLHPEDCVRLFRSLVDGGSWPR